MSTRYLIRAERDEEAKVWVATSDDVLGLAIEADSIPELVERLERILPELMVENGQVEGIDGYPEIAFTVMHDHVTRSVA